MTDINKLHMHTDGSEIALSFGMEKVHDVEKRVVEGFATLDNIDLTDDIVDADASARAFSKFRGNVRLMHDKQRPVGKVVSFEPSTYYDHESQKTYNGIKVAVMISKGAQDVWEMCMDGTLSGFSIGGATIKSSKVFRKDLGKDVNLIEEYMLTELSLVDSPMNPLTNIVSIHKAIDADADLEKGYEVSNLFWCAGDQISRKSHEPKICCPLCKDNMANMGSINENDDLGETLNKVLADLETDKKGGHLPVADTSITKNNEVAAVDETAGTLVEKVITTSSIGNVDEYAKDKVAVNTDPAPGEADANKKAQDSINGVPVAQAQVPITTKDDAEKSVDSLLSELHSMISKNSDKLAASFADKLEKSLAEINDKFESLVSQQTTLSTKFDEQSNALTETTKRLDVVSEGTAMKKSLDAENEVSLPTKPKSPFEGLFSGKYQSDE
jgi:hypothetical protein